MSSGYPSMPAELVLRMHQRLHDLHAKPNPLLSEYYKGFLKDIADKANKRGGEWKWRAQLAFYPLQSWQDGGKLTGIFAHGLFNARTFQVTADMVDAVSAMYAKTSAKVQHLPRGYQTVSENGFCWLDKPWVHKDVWGKQISVRAVTWSPQPIRQTVDITNGFGQKTGEREEWWDGFRISTWSLEGDPDDYAEVKGAFTQSAKKKLEEAYSDLGPLILLHTFNWPTEMRFGGPASGPNVMNGQGQGDDLISWIWCLWLMLDAEVATTRKVPQSEFRRRRGKTRKTLRYSDVNVVILRRHKVLNPDDPDFEHRPIDWSCRWMVAGHWRHIDRYDVAHHHFVPQHFTPGEVRCQTCDSRGAYVKAYLKGPDDMPVRAPRKQLYKLAR